MAEPLILGNETSLDFNKQQLDLVFEKKAVRKDIVVRVGMAPDVSVSMSRLYAQGMMQKLVELLLPVAMRLDDNGTMEVNAFSDKSTKLPDITLDNHVAYLGENILPRSRWENLTGGTRYSLGVEAFIREWGDQNTFSSVKGVLKSLFSRSKENTGSQEMLPGLILMQTDGDNNEDDNDRFHNMVGQLDRHGIFLVMIGTGHGGWVRSLVRTAERYPNVSALLIPDVEKANPNDVYESLTSDKFVKWLNSVGEREAARKTGAVWMP